MLVPRLRVQLVALIATILAGAALSFAQTKVTSTEADQQALGLTVYNSNTALVRDVRSLRLPSGNVELRFADVPSQIEPETVRIVSLTAPKHLTVLEQDYRYDLLSQDTLLQYYVGNRSHWSSR